MRHLVPVGLVPVLLAFLASGGDARAATPPPLINYQGVLRDSNDVPLDGPYDMTFRFFDALSGGDEILVDAHLISAGKAVIVSSGLFNVALGGGEVADGSGPGTYTSLTEVFAAYDAVYMEIQVGSETLSPRTRVLASAYAQNAARLEGRPAAGFVDTTSSQQIKTGSLVVGTTTSSGSGIGVEGQGSFAGGFFRDGDASGFAYLGIGDYGIDAAGTVKGGQFRDLDNTSSAHLASGVYGVTGTGTFAGGYFSDLDGSGGATIGFGDYGISAGGNLTGGYFADTNSSGHANVGFGDRGIEGFGNEAGGFFKDLDGSGQAFLGSGDFGIVASGSAGGGTLFDSDGSGGAIIGVAQQGIEGYGNAAGGFFRDRDDSGFAYTGIGDRGIEAYGSEMGGYFSLLDNSSFARLAWLGYGVAGYGNSAGGYFEDTNGSGYATVGVGDRGVQGFGNEMGGYFKDLDQSGYAVLGSGDRGIEAFGSEIAGHFQAVNATATADLATNGIGIDASGNTVGGLFADQIQSGTAWLGFGDSGVLGFGNQLGGYFLDTNSATSARVAYGAYTIRGIGVKSFVQNHPTDPNLVVVYHAPEGSEVAVYTRGTGIVSGGQAMVDIDPTFAWVANPDLGLTAHVTPRAPCSNFYVESVTTASLVVRCDNAAGGTDVPFDYLVYGLRIGFEALAPVQPKDEEAPIPSMQDQQALYASRPDLSRYNALERFMGLAAEGKRGEGGLAPVDLSRARALVAKIGEYDPAIHGPLMPTVGDDAPGTSIDRATSPLSRLPAGTLPPAGPTVPRSVLRPEPVVPGSGLEEGSPTADSPMLPQVPAGMTWLAVSEPVEVGDVLGLDPDNLALLRPADSLADPTVVGVAAGPSRPSADGAGLEAPVAVSGIALVRAEAYLGGIRPGDLLSASETPGHAVRAIDALPGTVLGKALDPLPDGTGTIRAVILLR